MKKLYFLHAGIVGNIRYLIACPQQVSKVFSSMVCDTGFLGVLTNTIPFFASKRQHSHLKLRRKAFSQPQRPTLGSNLLPPIWKLHPVSTETCRPVYSTKHIQFLKQQLPTVLSYPSCMSEPKGVCSRSVWPWVVTIATLLPPITPHHHKLLFPLPLK